MSDFISELNISSVNHGVSTGKHWMGTSVGKIDSYSPVDGKLIASVFAGDKDSYDAMINKAKEAFVFWRTWPAPKRGEVVRQIGEKLREFKEPLGQLVSYEMGKSLQ